LGEGDRFAFIWRMLPDLRFDGSTANNPSVTMTLLPLANSGSGYNTPASEGGTNTATVTRASVVPIEQYTGQVYTRVRGRQLAIKIESTAEGCSGSLVRLASTSALTGGGDG
jgi:hypothetical protein